MRAGLRFVSSLGVALLGALLLPGTAWAEPLSRDEVPAPLEPWVDWVLRGHEEARCPFFQGLGDRPACAWPSRLELDLGEGEGRFTQHWLLHRETEVALPGGAKHWPQDVRVDGRAAPIFSRNGRPTARLVPGEHTLTGRLRWDALPELLQIPPQTGIVRLRLGKRVVAFPKRDAEGRLWLQKRVAEEEGDEQRLEVSVHRRVVDSIPLLLDTRIKLDVAGRSREVLLGRALPEGFVPLKLASALPARLDADGRLRVQVRPGTWHVALEARHEGPVAALSLREADGPWDESEVWVFDAQPNLRVVTVEDAVAVDPAQTTLPDEWKHLPAYLMEPGRALRLVEKRRGDADPAPDELSLRRTFWLDFDGRGYTVTDSLDGVIRRSSRLEMGAATRLGRVALNGRDALITRLDESAAVGVEVARGGIQLVADSRIEANGAGLVSATIPAVGWDHDVQGLSGSLNIPPGWRLLHASGVDRATATWLNRWTLLDLFAVLVLAMVVLRLWGVGWGALALVALALSWTEPRAPQWAWAAALAGEALRRVVPTGRFPRFARGVVLYRGAAVAVLILLAIQFGVSQVRSGLFPALERPHLRIAALARPPVRPQQLEAEVAKEFAAAADAVVGRGATLVPSSAPYREGYRRRRGFEPDPKARITTGPGLPAWSWSNVQLSWSGPVERDQVLRLVLIPPFVNGLLAFSRVGLVAALVLCLLGVSAAGGRRLLRGAPAALFVSLFVSLFVALLATAMIAPAAARAADLPSPELLDELRRRLLEKPECRPDCAASPRLILEVEPRALRARFAVDVAAATAVPLPGSARGWSPELVLVDGQPAAGLLRSADGRLWVELAAGRHQVVLEGPLPDRDSVELPLPLRPHRVEARVKGWTVHGVHEDGLAEQNLQLVRTRSAGGEPRAEGAGPEALDSRELPPFVRIERNLRLGLEWQVSTTVTRLSALDAALVLELPLLPGESITSAGVRAEDGNVLVTMGPGVSSAAWSSLLSERPELVLKAGEAAPAAEVWRLDASPVWHVAASGIPPVHQPATVAGIREWRPWPGEQVALSVRRPAGVEGATTTIDASTLVLTPGLRATDATLDVKLRSSRGGQHTFTLPEGAVLQRVAIDGKEQPIRLEGRQLTAPLHPGTQQVEIAWREPRGAKTLAYRGSEVDLGLPSVNSEVSIAPSAGRWTLLAGGPRLGPAVLFWPLLVVLALVAFGLARLSTTSGLTPLRFHHWLLLGVGLTQVTIGQAALVVAWLLALGLRRRRGAEVSDPWFDLMQIGLAGLTLLALFVLFLSIRQGLLGLPEMQIAGNGSTGLLLRWYQDRAGAALSQPWVLSVSILFYRLAMLAWALWLAGALVRWLRWGWSCFGSGDLWRPLRRGRVEAETPAR